MGKLKNIRLALGEDESEKEGGLAIAQAKPDLRQPRLYQVVMLNDDFTPMEFVVEILETFFYMNREKATQVMLRVHTEGRAVCGVFPRDIAETKVSQINDYSKQSQHPLLCQVEVAQ